MVSGVKRFYEIRKTLTSFHFFVITATCSNATLYLGLDDDSNNTQNRGFGLQKFTLYLRYHFFNFFLVFCFVYNKIFLENITFNLNIKINNISNAFKNDDKASRLGFLLDK